MPAPTAPTAAPTALLTDRYELTMLDAALRDGTADRRVAFAVFARGLPAGRRYGVVAGTGRLLDALGRFRFDADVLDFLARERVVSGPTLDWLADARFTGDVRGYGEGETYLPGSPVLVVEGTFGEAVLLETLVLSILNHDCAVAAAASRMTTAAGDRPCLDMGSRRTHEGAAVAAARAAYVAGFESTSNLAAHAIYGVPSAGTSAHAFTLLHDTESAAFAAQVEALGAGTTLLVDTYDVPTGIRTAVEVAGPGLGAVRLDSGDLAAEAVRARALLDELGNERTGVVVTSDLDEYAVAALAAAPVDRYGIGTSLVTGSGHPTAGLVYKLVARHDRDDPASGDDGWLAVAKASAGKATIGGRPWGFRRLAEGRAVAEVVRTRPEAQPDERPLMRDLVRGGEVVGAEPLEAARARHALSRAELPDQARRLSPGGPAIPTERG